MSGVPSGIAALPKVSCRLEEDGTLLRVVLDHPKGNVVDGEMTSSLRQVVKAAAGLNSLRLLVLCGEGKHFSYGASVEEHRADRVGGMLDRFHGLFRDLLESDVPMLALVRGQCLGGGLELAAFCDRVVVEEGACLGQPEIRLGVFAPIGSLVLPWRCGARGAELLLTGRAVGPAEALEMGLADVVVPAGEGDNEVRRWLDEELRPLSASSLRLARRAARWELHGMMRRAIDDVERLYLDDLMSTRDAVEGIEAFLAKRRPEWSDG